jgi:hypothetical protein
MPSAELMTWNPAQKRWFKQYRGKMYAVPGYSIDSTSPYGLWLWGIGRVGHDAAVGYRFNLHCLL